MVEFIQIFGNPDDHTQVFFLLQPFDGHTAVDSEDSHFSVKGYGILRRFPP
jgi:hypothetical protein